MRYLNICTLVLSLLVVPACERANPPDDQHDAGVVRPPDDGGSATDGSTPADARTPRPSAGPLDPDLTIDCTLDIVIESYRADGRLYSVTTTGEMVWPEQGAPPSDVWLCYEAPYPIYSCTPPLNMCPGATPRDISCARTLWSLAPDGAYFVRCYGNTSTDTDGDGEFDNVSETNPSWLAIIR